MPENAFSATFSLDALLAPQPAEASETSSWLERLRVAVESALPPGFTLQATWGDHKLDLTFELRPTKRDPEELQYTLTHPVALPDNLSYGQKTLEAETLSFSGSWISVTGLRDRVQDQVHSFVTTARESSPIANQAIAILELHRVVRLRSRVGEDAIKNGAHDGDISELQAEIAAFRTAAR